MAAQREEGATGKKKRKKKKKAKGSDTEALESEEVVVPQEPPKFEVQKISIQSRGFRNCSKRRMTCFLLFYQG